MQNRSRGDYEIAGHEIVAEGADMRVSVLTLAAGQEVPWHYHSEISDSFVCLEGPMLVETRAPETRTASNRGSAAPSRRRPRTASQARPAAPANS